MLFILFLSASQLSVGAALADMIDTSGMEPWETCALCHGLDGNSRMSKFPKLAGQSQEYIEKQLRDFRSGQRNNDGGTMTAIASGELEEKNIGVVARYFAAQEILPPAEPTKSEPDSSAKKLFQLGDQTRELPACRSCHQKTTQQNTAIPFITSQHEDYIAKQLTDFKNGDRGNDNNATMRSIATKLSADEIANLATYISSLPR